MVFPKNGRVGSGSPDFVLRFLRLVAGSNFILTGGDLGTEAGVTMPLGPIFRAALDGGGPGGGGYIP